MKLYEEIEKQIASNKKVVIAIDGPCASGKSTLGKLLEKKYNALLFHTDNYFLSKEKKTIERLQESGGNVDYERIKSEIMDNLDNEYFQSNFFNCVTNTLEERDRVLNNQVIIIEGAYSMHKILRDYYTLKVFLEIDSTLQIDRILARNGELMLTRFEKEWIPLENYYFESEDLLNLSDLVIDLNIKNYYLLK